MTGTNSVCLCGSGRSYGDCCEPFHAGRAAAPTAERLMRSRYSAFSLSRIDFLIDTLHPSQRRPQDRESLARTCADTRWTGLRILKTAAGTAIDDSGHVEFVAAFEEEGAAGRLHERSSFVKEDGRWFYVTGEYDDLSPMPEPGRNEACWCGRGKKYKKCHGRRS